MTTQFLWFKVLRGVDVSDFCNITKPVSYFRYSFKDALPDCRDLDSFLSSIINGVLALSAIYTKEAIHLMFASDSRASGKRSRISSCK